MDKEIRIVVADDHPIFRQGLRQVITAVPGLEVVGEAADGHAALSCIQETRPDVALLDVDMPGKDGFGVAQEIIRQKLPVAVVFLTMHKSESVFTAALDLGVKGYVLKDSALADVVQSLKAAAAGENFISPALSTFLVNRSRRAMALGEQIPSINDLTPAERRILRLIAQSKVNKEIASELCISVRTVEHHRSNICFKLGLKASHSLIRFAIAHQSEI
jgi:DNA-binding NarL/FixJ family response regulator